ncbi:hypothetical protein FRZ06_13165 [Anoxybacterium hadale]|uniref:Uncharacterized protein n=1 Tax=Anoxybacterium hadale TaxID=3408580 RepID=A0ACD1ACL9_9FIRM|nr:hypothetical protein FRZ06_13165 [Clostridiales bacterium]
MYRKNGSLENQYKFNEVFSLRTQITKLQTKITKINSGDGDEDTKQQLIEIIQTQIQQLESQIQRIESQQSKAAASTEEVSDPSNLSQNASTVKDPYSNNKFDILV